MVTLWWLGIVWHLKFSYVLDKHKYECVGNWKECIHSMTIGIDFKSIHCTQMYMYVVIWFFIFNAYKILE